MARRLIVSLVGALALGAAFAAPAAAHDALVASDPPDGSVLEAAPEAIVLEFTGELLDINPALEITDADGAPVTVGEAQLDGKFATWKLVDSLAGGEYDVVWVVTSSDGHPIDGTFSFTSPATVGNEQPDGESPAQSPAESETPTDAESPAEAPTDAESPEVEATEDDATDDATDDAASEAPATDNPDDPADLSNNAEAWFFGGLAITALIAVAIVLGMRRNRDPNGPPGQH